MARKARIKDEFGIFYIKQTGSKVHKLFEHDADRTYFLELLRQAQEKFQFKLYAYCLLSQHEYHLILDVNGSDLSSIMKSINIGYAMYKKCPERLFRDRYKSSLISHIEALYQKIDALHKKGTGDSSPFNSFCTYNIEKPSQINFVTPVLLSENSSDCQEAILKKKDCKNCIRSLEEAQHKLQEMAASTGQTYQQMLQDKYTRNQLIKEFRRCSTLSLKELGSLFGGLSESAISKLLNQK